MKKSEQIMNCPRKGTQFWQFP